MSVVCHIAQVDETGSCGLVLQDDIHGAVRVIQSDNPALVYNTLAVNEPGHVMHRALDPDLIPDACTFQAAGICDWDTILSINATVVTSAGHCTELLQGKPGDRINIGIERRAHDRSLLHESYNVTLAEPERAP